MSTLQRKPTWALWASLLLLVAGCNRPEKRSDKGPPPGPKTQPVTVQQPAKLTSIETSATGPTGEGQRVACVTCHTIRRPDALPESASDLKEFHQGLSFKHGDLRCGSCHEVGRQDGFRLADGRHVDSVEVMSLCGQCHGTQRRSYDHGAHGGMLGHWDLSRGPRTRNSCVACHDPHVPAYQGGKPVLLPKDRGVQHAAGEKEVPHG